jgi:large subunit ribosomal protein L25
MATYSLKAQTREQLGKKVYKLRDDDLIPCVLYGQDIKNQNLTVKKQEFLKLYNEAGASSLIDLQIDETKPVKILIHDYQLDPRTDNIIHIDFYQIKEGKKITTTVELEFVGESPAVKEWGGIIVKNYDEVEIECLPSALETIDTVKVDLTVLKNFNDAIHIGDLKVPEGIKLTEEPDTVVVQVSQPKEEVEEVVAKPIEGEEGEEGVEGEEPKSEAEGGEKKDDSGGEKNQDKSKE